MNFNIKASHIAICAGISLLLACSKKNAPEPVNEEELITRVEVWMIPQNGGDTLQFISSDPDGNGPQVPVITADTLMDSTTYFMLLQFFSGDESINIEIEEEASDHQIFLSFSPSLGIIHTYEDTDPEGFPLGLQNQIITLGSGSGSMTLTLRHQPDKSATGVKEGEITNAGGSTDAEINFPVHVY